MKENKVTGSVISFPPGIPGQVLVIIDGVPTWVDLLNDLEIDFSRSEDDRGMILSECD